MPVLSALIYQDLRRVAARCVRQERSGNSLNATALVHETYLRLLGVNSPSWKNRAHFFGAVAEAMRRILVDRARARNTRRRYAAQIVVNGVAEELGRDFVDYIALDAALENLKAIDGRQARVVELRFFVGLSIEEIAELLEVSARTVKRDWEYARVWLFRELCGA